jgi:hypothetical protein
MLKKIFSIPAHCDILEIEKDMFLFVCNSFFEINTKLLIKNCA